MMLLLQLMGGGAARYDTNWSDYQAPPQPNSFSAKAASLSDDRFRDYLRRRGYGAGGQNLRPPLDGLREADRRNIRAVFNFGVIPEWAAPARADFPAGEAGEQQWRNALADPALPGEFLHDFIVFSARQKGGMGALENTAGWQMFNEVNDIYGERAGQLPRTAYFAMGEQALRLVHEAYAAVGWSRESAAAPPPVILPSLAGSHSPLFYDGLIDHVVKDTRVAQANGGLAIEAVAFHPYGARVDPWNDPLTGEDLGDAARDTMIYHRMLRPTDDRLTWQALIARDPAQSKKFGLKLYSELANPGDAYFDANSEQGTEQTMAQLAQNGYGHVRVHFTEWGQTTSRGTAAEDGQSLWNTAFADPYRYGFIAPGNLLPEATAENLQAEIVMQTVGLIESWDFVDTATVYEFFDQAVGGHEGRFGLARGADANGQPEWKPAGLAYQAYLSGKEIHLSNIAGRDGTIGVDVHVAAKGEFGGFNALARHAPAHELALLREGADAFNAGAGDDEVFGGPGNDNLFGGSGYDRLFGGADNDVLDGGAGADKLKGDAGDDTLTGGAGADHFAFAAYANTGSGFSGHDAITDFNVAEDKLLIVGGYRVADLLDAKLFPQLARDEAGGVKLVFADNGANVLLKGVQRAQLTAANFHILQSDRTVAFGRTSTEIVVGSAAPDDLRGTGSDDLIDGGRGGDRMAGGQGNDTYVVASPADAVSELDGVGHDRIVSRVSFVLPPAVETLLLDSSKPLDGTGNELANEISGNPNRNVLMGGDGNDRLNGGAGRDTLDGNGGDDVLTGGSGNDDFIVGAGQGADVITDFAHGDSLHVRGVTGFTDAEAVLAAAREQGPDLVIAFAGGGQVTVLNMGRAALNPDAVRLE